MKLYKQRKAVSPSYEPSQELPLFRGTASYSIRETNNPARQNDYPYNSKPPNRKL